MKITKGQLKSLNTAIRFMPRKGWDAVPPNSTLEVQMNILSSPLYALDEIPKEDKIVFIYWQDKGLSITCHNLIDPFKKPCPARALQIGWNFSNVEGIKIEDDWQEIKERVEDFVTKREEILYWELKPKHKIIDEADRMEQGALYLAQSTVFRKMLLDKLHV